VDNKANNAAIYFIDRHPAEGRGDKVAFIDADGSHTYGDLARKVNQAGNLLRAIGVARGDRVMLCLNDSIAFPALFFGALKIGAIPVPVNTLLVTEDYRNLVQDCAPRAVAVSAALLDRCEPALTGALDPARILIAGGGRVREARPNVGRAPHHYVALDTALGSSSDQLEALKIAPDEAGFLLYSSGSTGGPKGVIHRHGDLRATAQLYSTGLLALDHHDVIFSASKLFFAYGLGNSCTFTVHAGATAILIPDRPTPETVLATLRDHRVTAFFGFPTLYSAILAHLENHPDERLENLRLCVSAGEALPAALGERWRTRFGLEILDGIGSTESLHIFISNRPDDVRHGTSGKPVAGYGVTLRDDHGAEVTSDHIGDLWCRGPSIALGYWNNPAATNWTFIDGWLRTGDKYSRNADGYYHYAGRADDMLKVAGVWVSPHEVESALIAHPAVLEAAVVAHRDGDGLVKPKAFVVLKDAASASPALAATLIQFVKGRIAPYKHPHWIEFRADLPKTATGKIRRNVLRDQG
jgi:benzoate-CoA ligase family protein